MSKTISFVMNIRTISSVHMAMINGSDMVSEDKYSALGYVTDKIAELIEKVVVDK